MYLSRSVMALGLAFGLAFGMAAARGQADETNDLRVVLRGTSEVKAVEAARKLAEDTSPAVIETILDELAIGAPPKVQAELLAGLAGRRDMRAFDVLSQYASNRNVSLRKKAVVAIAELSDPRVGPLLIATLSDAVEDVRAAAARGLTARKDRTPEAEDALVKLLAHKDAAAVLALGALGGPATARRIGELIGDIPESLLSGTFTELLKRADFGPDPLRLQVVIAVGRLSGPEATTTLKDYVAATEKEARRPSRLKAQKLIELRGAQL